jgi:pimeloyl-ACP methyl ester carboxylesterase
VQIAEPAAALTSPRRIRAHYDVSAVVDEPGEWLIHAELLIPAVAPGTDHLTLLCCTPGGGCTGDYFDLGEPDAGFSFARYATAAGFACALIDNLGTGRSTPGANLWLSPHTVARAGVEAFRLAAEDLRALLPATTTVTTIAVGHSMGAMLALIGEAIVPRHAAIACLGFTPAGLPSVLSPEERHIAFSGPVSLPALTAIARQRLSGPAQPAADHPAPGPFPFNLPDTDPAALAALRGAATNLLPLPGFLSLLPGNISESIRQIAIPVFLGGGDHEPWHKAAELVPAFERSPDITFYTLVDSAHNHNVAATRELLWQRLLDWAAVVATTGAGLTTL